MIRETKVMGWSARAQILRASIVFIKSSIGTHKRLRWEVSHTDNTLFFLHAKKPGVVSYGQLTRGAGQIQIKLTSGCPSELQYLLKIHEHYKSYINNCKY